MRFTFFSNRWPVLLCCLGLALLVGGAHVYYERQKAVLQTSTLKGSFQAVLYANGMGKDTGYNMGSPELIMFSDPFCSYCQQAEGKLGNVRILPVSLKAKPQESLAALAAKGIATKKEYLDYNTALLVLLLGDQAHVPYFVWKDGHGDYKEYQNAMARN